MSKSKTITLITGSESKLEQIRNMFGSDFPLEISAKDIKLHEYQGTSQEICLEKCRQAAKFLNRPVFIVEASLCFNAWGDLPGKNKFKSFLKSFLSLTNTK